MKKRKVFAFLPESVLIITLMTSGCARAESTPIRNPGPSLSSTVPSSSPTIPPAAPTLKPSPTIEPFEPSARVISDVEVMFDFSTDRCSNSEHPDLPVRAFRDSDGNIQMIISSPTNYRLVGPDLDSLQPDCSPILQSEFSSDPSVYSTSSWLASTYTLDGSTVYGLVHNEYHGDQDGILPAACPSGLHNLCTLISLTYAVSTDGGATYVKPPNPGHLVAAFPHQYDPDSMRALWQPSNIVKSPNDGYYYVLVLSTERPANQASSTQGMCVMRTRTLDDPTSWRAWDGKGFDLSFINPYVETGADPAEHTCELVSLEAGSLTYGLFYSSYFEQFLAIGVSEQPMSGFYFSLSEDLVNWSPPEFIMYAPQAFSSGGQPPYYAYPTLIDPESPSDNYDITGQSPYLYYIRFNTVYGQLDTDLLRVKIEFHKQADQASAVETSAVTNEPVTVSMGQQETTLPSNTPIELTFGWADSTSSLVSAFLSQVIFEVQVDGVLLTDINTHWEAVKQMTPTSFATRWIYPIGILETGQHVVEYRISFEQPFTDGSGTTYSGEVLNGVLTITIVP